MLYLVTGGSGSGKSEYAETLVCELCREKGGGAKYYIATMIPYGEETKRKIARHQELRKEKAFHTKECFLNLKSFVQEEFVREEYKQKAFAVEKAAKQLQLTEKEMQLNKRFALLECMSNLTANELFEEGGAARRLASVKSSGSAKCDVDCDRVSGRQDSVLSERLAEEITQGVRLLVESCDDVVVVTNEVCSESAEDSPEMTLYKQVLAGVNRKLAKMAVQVTEVVYGQPLDVSVHTADSGIQKEDSQKADNQKGARALRLIIGGAFQGKLSYAEERYPGLEWVDGAACGLDEILRCEGLYHFETYIKRRMQARSEETIVSEILTSNPGIVLVGREIGYGLVPVDAFERNYREQTGRICTELANYAQSVERVVCGIPVKIK